VTASESKAVTAHEIGNKNIRRNLL